MKYYISKKLKTSFDDAEERTIEALKEEGFGVLTQIDIQEKLKEKLNVDFRKYKILGACNPPFAYKALQQEDKVGVMLPCNVIIQEIDNKTVEVSAVNPVASMTEIKNTELASIASGIKEKLDNAINSL